MNKHENTADAELQALRWFYERLTLNEADRKELFEKRGLTNAVIDAFGFRSNVQSNSEILLGMAEHFSVEVLIESGLWKRDEKKSSSPKPNPQFFGMSIASKRDSKTGRKIRNKDGNTVSECGWNHPVLIPYFNQKGQLVHLRPHKGMMAGKTPRFYVARPILANGQVPAPGKPVFAVICEGEFKAAALWQVLGGTITVAALPGITMAKPLFPDIEEWLESTGCQQVVVGYDNEEKGEPNLPGYQEDIRRRFDAQIWARYLAQQVSKIGYEGKVCVLPNSWRDEKGKADWDGYLAMRLKGAGMADASQAEWDKVRSKIAGEFLAVIQRALPVSDLHTVFDKESERIIRNGLAHISYEPCLPVGGDEEQSLARRLHRLAKRLKQKDWFPLKTVSFLHHLAHAYEATAGRYYKMRVLTEKQLEEWQKLRETAQERGDEDAKRACDLVMRGRKWLKETKRGHIPESISDFYLQPHYVLQRLNGTRTRILTIHSVHGMRSRLVGIPWDELGCPTKLRDWLHKNISGAAFDGGQTELTAMHEDLGHALAFKDVLEVPLRGRHAQSKLWFFEDWAISDENEYLPDPKTGIFWIQQEDRLQGYCFCRNTLGEPRDREDEEFRQGVPYMKPENISTPEENKALFAKLLVKLPEAVGWLEAHIALGMAVAVAAGPEIFSEWSCFPGLWVHGEGSQGKSSLVRWLIRIWGFLKDKGLPLPVDEKGTTTMAMLAGALGQYGELQLWLDEFQLVTPPWARAILKNVYDRAQGGKRDFGGAPREFLASVIVSGAATSADPQTKSRFAHIQISRAKRTANHYQWFQSESREFYRLGRHILRNRKQFVETLTKVLRLWMDGPALSEVDERTRMVHGVAYAGLIAACELFDAELDLRAFRTNLIESCRHSAQDVQENASVDLFWRELASAVTSGAFTRSESRRVFKVMEDKTALPPVSEVQSAAGAQQSFKAWKSYFLYFQPGPLMQMLRAHLRRGGKELPISQSDLYNHMKPLPYFHPSKNGSGHRQKFEGQSTRYCWCIKLDLHPLGLIHVSDEEFEQSFIKEDGAGHCTMDDWTDPRKGDLFEIIELLQDKPGSNEQTSFGGA